MSDEYLSVRKKEHLEICSTDQAAFKYKTNGFEHYDFIHCADTEVEIEKIDLETFFFSKKISYPFLISCMTGGTDKANNINLELAHAAKQLNIPLGLGSIRYAIEEGGKYDNLIEIRNIADNVPLLGNIGAAQVINKENHKKLEKIIENVQLDAMVIHLNPLQEILQKEGEPYFNGLNKSIEKFVRKTEIPVIVKEVGSGISKQTAERLLNTGIKGIDVAGSGGTSWAAVEIIRNKKNHSEFWDWGLPTSYCIREIASLRRKHNFLLIGSGGINSAFDAAKSLALGSNISASARIVLQKLNEAGTEGVIALVNEWFEEVKKIMFLTGVANLKEFNKKKLILKKDLH